MYIKAIAGRRRVGLAVVTLMLGGVISSASSSVVAVTTASSADFGFSQPSGYLVLELRTSSNGAPSGRVLQYSQATTGSPASLIDTQRFSVTRCEVSTDGRLLRFESSSERVGLYNNGLGTKTKGNCTPAEGRTEGGETFTVSLGSKFGPSYSIDSSEFDIEGKFSANLLWTAVNGSVSAGSGSQNLAWSTDSGPDAGTGDNNLVTVGAKGVAGDNYTSLALRTAGGEFALDGGGDGTYATQNSLGTNDSVLFLSTSSSYDYTVNCGERVEATDSELAESDAADQTDSRVTDLFFVRLANKGQTSCAPVGVTVSASDTPQLDGAFLDHSTSSALGVTQNVKARVMIVWTVEMAGKTQAQIDAELSREVQFAMDGQSVPVSNCLHVPAGVAANPLDPTSTAVIDHPDNTPWCLMSDSRVVSDNTIIQTQYYSGNGDPRFY